MKTGEFAALEWIEYDAAIDLYRAAPADIRTGLDVDVHESDAATCLSCRGLQPPAIFRRAVGLGIRRPATETDIEEVAGYMEDRGERFVIPFAAGCRPAGIADWLGDRGFEPGYAWMKFSRPCAEPLEAQTDLDVRVVDAGDGARFGAVVAESFGMPDTIAPWLGQLAGRPDWICVMAKDGDRPVAAGAVFVRGDHAWLGFGGTLSSHRRRGAQGALLSLRLAEAAARGARIAVTETGERLPDLPSHSYRNILRAGFVERYLRQHYLSPAPR